MVMVAMQNLVEKDAKSTGFGSDWREGFLIFFIFYVFDLLGVLYCDFLTTQLSCPHESGMSFIV